MSERAPLHGDESAAEQHPIRLCDHPRARHQIALARGWTGIGTFVLVAALSLNAGLSPFEACLRALPMGAAGYVAAWALAVTVWRHLALAEAGAAREAAEARRDALLKEIERRSGMLARQPQPGPEAADYGAVSPSGL